MIHDTEVKEAVKLLEEFADLEGSELGEFWDRLISLARYDYCMSDEFKVAVRAEILAQAKDAKENFQVVEEEEPRPSRKYKTLRHKSEQ